MTIESFLSPCGRGKGLCLKSKGVTQTSYFTSGLILSLSKDEAAAHPVDASSSHKLRMRRMSTDAPGLRIASGLASA